jgi:hypothetical protein
MRQSRNGANANEGYVSTQTFVKTSFVLFKMRGGATQTSESQM